MSFLLQSTPSTAPCVCSSAEHCSESRISTAGTGTPRPPGLHCHAGQPTKHPRVGLDAGSQGSVRGSTFGTVHPGCSIKEESFLIIQYLSTQFVLGHGVLPTLRLQ